jgi:CDP-glycerol glycerophosphotransferase (TagB/SpsB family)
MGGHFYTKTPVISDVMVVPGEFWRNLWPEDERHKILVFNPPGLISRVKKDQTRRKKVLTYFSWPLFKSPFYSSSELIDGFIEMFHRLLLQEKCEILVRCHPLENPYDFVKRWKQLYGPLPMSLRIEKHEPLDRVLERTDVALMFRSTVMLNCMLAEIPVIVPGWIDFGWNQTLKKVTGIYLAIGFADLEKCLEEWLKEPPRLSGRSVEYFVRSPGEGEDSFRSVVERLTTEPQKKREDLPRILSTTI